MRFENRTILIISPQPWDHLHLSKHHYAIELSRRGNRVYFLEPPADNMRERIRVSPTEHRELWVISYRPAFPFVIRFHARWLYDRLLKLQIRRITSAIARPIDVLWCFDFNLFSDLRAFHPRVCIFNPVDPIPEAHHVSPARTADLVISVSDDILGRVSGVSKRSAVINHGLSAAFANRARNSMRSTPVKRERKKVGYAGNLLRKPVGRAAITEMIASLPEAEFHFWGPFDPGADTPREIVDFVNFLTAAKNVTLHGPVDADELARALNEMDCLVLTYSLDRAESDRSNSHKILEYLSTGKVTVSSRISMYENLPDLIRMPGSDDDSELPRLLEDTLQRLDEFNSSELQDRRRAFALDHTYERQLERIEALLT